MHDSNAKGGGSYAAVTRMGRIVERMHEKISKRQGDRLIVWMGGKRSFREGGTERGGGRRTGMTLCPSSATTQRPKPQGVGEDAVKRVETSKQRGIGLGCVVGGVAFFRKEQKRGGGCEECEGVDVGLRGSRRLDPKKRGTSKPSNVPHEVKTKGKTTMTRSQSL